MHPHLHLQPCLNNCDGSTLKSACQVTDAAVPGTDPLLPSNEVTGYLRVCGE